VKSGERIRAYIVEEKTAALKELKSLFVMKKTSRTDMELEITEKFTRDLSMTSGSVDKPVKRDIVA